MTISLQPSNGDEIAAELGSNHVDRKAGRRAFMQTVGLGVAGAALLSPGSVQQAEAQAVTDIDIQNFAINFEYLGAEFYLRACTGAGLNPGEYSQGANATKTGPGVGSVSGGRQVNFDTDAIRNYAFEFAVQERLHVNTLRRSLGENRVGRPPLNIGTAFTVAAQAAGLGSNFDAYADENSFLMAAFMLEDVCVTALLGAAPLIQSKAVLAVAGGFLGTEGYQAGSIRTTLYNRGFQAQVQKISDFRDSLDNTAPFNDQDDDQGIGTATTANISPTSPTTGQAFARTPANVLNIVYGNPNKRPGGFFPNAVNGNIQ